MEDAKDFSSLPPSQREEMREFQESGISSNYHPPSQGLDYYSMTGVEIPELFNGVAAFAEDTSNDDGWSRG